MSDQTPELLSIHDGDIIQFPLRVPTTENIVAKSKIKTPLYDGLLLESDRLNTLSEYRSSFNYSVYRDLEVRYKDSPVRGGIICKTDLKLANNHSSCVKCHYALELDTYGRGCAHECAYCYAKDELSLHGYWNNPIPFPININEIRKIFYTVFETSKKSKWREVLEMRVPIRIGSMSDSFMWSDLKYKVTLEVLNILKYYQYPYIIFTRSDLAAHDTYLKAIDPNLASIQFSICGNNEQLTKVIEPGAPGIKRRLAALKKIGEHGIRTAVRINPLFPTFPDGYFTDRNSVERRFKGQEIPKLDFFDIEKADEFIALLAESRVKTILAGFVRLKSSSINLINRQTGINLFPFFRPEVVNTGLRGNREKKYSDQEIAYYYTKLKVITNKFGINFSTCYIGNGFKDFYQYQKLWDNKEDCCDVRGKVNAFKTSSQDIPWETRMKFTQNKESAIKAREEETKNDERYAIISKVTKLSTVKRDDLIEL